MTIRKSGIGKKLGLLLAVGACVCLSACNKDDEAASGRNRMILGRWRLVSHGQDLDRNGTLDPGEVFTASDSLTSDLEYRSGGQGARITTFWQTPVSRPFTWSLQAGETQLFETYNKSVSGTFTDTALIRELNDQTLVTIELQRGDSTLATYRRL